jgi:hypothetical protein
MPVSFTRGELLRLPKRKPAVLDDFAAKGDFTSRSFTVGTDWYSLPLPWLSIQIYTGGLPWEVGEAPLKMNEGIAIDLKAKPANSSPALFFICLAGTAAIRVFRLK